MNNVCLSRCFQMFKVSKYCASLLNDSRPNPTKLNPGPSPA